MENKSMVSNSTRNYWLLDAGLFLGAVTAAISGIYFLIFPDGGYMGGRNPYYGIRIIFDRSGWEWIHTWISVGFVTLALIHLVLHWKWVVSTTKRIFRSLIGRQTSKMSAGGWRNAIVDGIVGVSFLICAVSGIYFLIVGESRGGLIADPNFIFTRMTWDLIHTWSSVLFISGFIIHFAIHWGWVTKVTRKIFSRPGRISLGQVAKNKVLTN
jgi:hypothetical protein